MIGTRRYRPHGNVTELYANNTIEADHGRLKARLRPMRGLKRARSLHTIAAGHRVRAEPAPRPLRARNRSTSVPPARRRLRRAWQSCVADTSTRAAWLHDASQSVNATVPLAVAMSLSVAPKAPANARDRLRYPRPSKHWQSPDRQRPGSAQQRTHPAA